MNNILSETIELMKKKTTMRMVKKIINQVQREECVARLIQPVPDICGFTYIHLDVFLASVGRFILSQVSSVYREMTNFFNNKFRTYLYSNRKGMSVRYEKRLFEIQIMACAYRPV